jgi:2-phosphosulfolactate phosphatase
MKCSVILHAAELKNADLRGKTAVVIDAFRATSVMVEGLFNGASAFIPVEAVDEARRLKEANPEMLLGGERDGVRIEGFDLDNSPLSYGREVVQNRKVVLTTTNGTRALTGSAMADEVFLGSFLNLSAVAQRVAGSKELVLVCSGSNDTISLEDSVCAGAILYHVELLKSIEWTDNAFMFKSLYLYVASALTEYLSSGSHYKYLYDKGFGADLDFCLQLNRRSVVPRFDGYEVKL